MSDELPELRGESKDFDSRGRLPALASQELRASDADREQVAERLREAMAEGRLDMGEFEARLEAAFTARTYGQLAPLTRDLPAQEPVGRRMPETAGESGDRAAHIGREATSRSAFAVFGGFSRRGRWVVPRAFTAFAVWGGGEIDLREADFEAREAVIRCFTIWGGISVTVPPELHVRVTGVGIMGGFGGDRVQEGDADAPHVTVTGLAVMGGVGVRRKLRKAQKRRLRELEKRAREERRELRRARGLEKD